MIERRRLRKEKVRGGVREGRKSRGYRWHRTWVCPPIGKDDNCTVVGPGEGQNDHQVPPLMAGSNVIHLAWKKPLRYLGDIEETTKCSQHIHH